MINLPGCIVFLPGVAKIFQIRKIQRFDISDAHISDLIIKCFGLDKSCWKRYFKYLVSKLTNLHSSPSRSFQSCPNLDLAQLFQIWPDIVLIEMNDIDNIIFTTTLINSRRWTVFSVWASNVYQETFFL